MLNFLKRFGLGILYVLFSPFIFAFLLLWGVFDLIIFFVQLIKGLISFFKGKSFFSEFEEDIEAKRILSLEALNEPNSSPNNDVPLNQINDENEVQIKAKEPEKENNNDEPKLSHPSIDEENNQ